MGNVPPLSVQPQDSARKKKWVAMVRHCDKFTGLRHDSIDKLPTKRLDGTMIILRNAIDEHLTAPALFEAFQGVYVAHPTWEMPIG
ncbi:hypothetical protein E8E11_001575 [Didymella keratinophila]|nr:hypothetical protein E8E11_001575 [Didymella keratinophila]